MPNGATSSPRCHAPRTPPDRTPGTRNETPSESRSGDPAGAARRRTGHPPPATAPADRALAGTGRRRAYQAPIIADQEAGQPANRPGRLPTQNVEEPFLCRIKAVD